VQAERQARVAIVEGGYQYCSRDDGEEGECRQNAMSNDEALIVRVTGESITHTIVAHGVVVQSLNVGEKEIVSGAIPGAIPDRLYARRICCIAGRGEAR